MALTSALCRVYEGREDQFQISGSCGKRVLQLVDYSVLLGLCGCERKLEVGDEQRRNHPELHLAQRLSGTAMASYTFLLVTVCRRWGFERSRRTDAESIQSLLILYHLRLRRPPFWNKLVRLLECALHYPCHQHLSRRYLCNALAMKWRNFHLHLAIDHLGATITVWGGMNLPAITTPLSTVCLIPAVGS